MEKTTIPDELRRVSDKSHELYDQHYKLEDTGRILKNDVLDTEKKLIDISHVKNLILFEKSNDFPYGYGHKDAKLNRNYQKSASTAINFLQILDGKYRENYAKYKQKLIDNRQQSKGLLWDAEKHYQEHASEYHDLGRIMMIGDGEVFVGAEIEATSSEA